MLGNWNSRFAESLCVFCACFLVSLFVQPSFVTFPGSILKLITEAGLIYRIDRNIPNGLRCLDFCLKG